MPRQEKISQKVFELTARVLHSKKPDYKIEPERYDLWVNVVVAFADEYRRISARFKREAFESACCFGVKS